MSSFWLKYTISLPTEKEEAFTLALLDTGYTLGWTEPAIEVVTTENGYDFTTQDEQPVIAYVFEPLEDEQQIQQERLVDFLQEWGTDVQLVKAEQVKEENDSWKEEFEPVQIGEWTIAPSWKQDQLAEAKTPVLWIDPGAAFGTGYHGTTQDSLLFLQEINLGGKRVIDVGAGSGILSLFCVKQGAALPVVAIDVNPECTYEIMQNAQHNNIPADSVQVLIGDASSEEVRGQLPEQADLILMNIGGDENMMILPKIGHVLAAKGRLILSGLVEWNRDKIAAHLQMLGYKVIGERQTDEWVTLLTERT